MTLFEMCNKFHTCILIQATGVLQVEVWQRAMYMRAYLLTCFCGAKNTNDRDLRGALALRRTRSPPKNRVELSRRSLVMIDAVQAETESVHEGTGAGCRRARVVERW